MTRTLIAACLIATAPLVTAGPASADMVSGESFWLLDAKPPRGTRAAGLVRFTSGDAATLQKPSMQVASRLAGTVAPVASFERLADPSWSGKSIAEAAWAVEFQATLNRRALPGNAIFLLYDASDADAIAERQVLTMQQAQIKGGQHVAARMHLSPDDGFKGNKVYLLRIVQLVEGQEVVLAQGELLLL